MPANSVAIRLGVDGQADLRRAFDDVSKAGTTAFESISKSMDATGAATDKQLARYQRLAQAAREAQSAGQSQSNINSLFGMDKTAKSARDSADAFSDYFRAADDVTKRTSALKAAIDPAGSALDKMNGSIANANDLFKRGAISSAEHSAAISLARRGYDDFAKSLKVANDNGSLTKLQFDVLTAAGRHAFDAMAVGASPLRAVTMEAGHLSAAIGEGGVSGLLSGVASQAGRLAGLLTNPIGAIGALTVAIGGYIAAGVSFRESNRQIELALTGVGRQSGATAKDIDLIAVHAAQSGRITQSSAKNLATSLAGIGRVDVANIPGLVNMAPGLAALTGESVSKTGDYLAKLFSGDPAKAAEELNAHVGSLDDKTMRYVATLSAQGRYQDAIALTIRALTPRLDEAAQKTSAWAKAWDAVGGAASAAWQWAGRTPNNVPATQQRVDEVTRRLQELGPQPEGRIGFNPLDTSTQERLQLQAELKRLQEDLRKQQADAQKTAEDRAATLSSDVGKSARALLPDESALKSMQDKVKFFKDALRDPLVLMKVEDVDQANRAVDALSRSIRNASDDMKLGSAQSAAMFRAADFSRSTAGMNAVQKSIANIRHETEEAVRGAKSWQDTLTALRVNDLKIDAFRIDTERNVVRSTNLPQDFVTSVMNAEGSQYSRNRNSSATGSGQFIDETWLRLFKDRFSERAAGMSDQDILARRTDLDDTREMIKAYAQENARALERAGLAVTDANLQLSHFLGAAGAQTILRADPGANAAALLPRAAASNPEVFRNGNATVQDIRDYAASRVYGNSPGIRGLENQTAVTRSMIGVADLAAAAQAKQDKVQELLNTEISKGSEIGQRFATAQALMAAKAGDLTPEAAKQREAILGVADAYGKAAAGASNWKLQQDLVFEREQLGRTSQDQSIESRLRGLKIGEDDPAHDSLASTMRLTATLGDLKSTSSDAFKGLLSDLREGKRGMDILTDVTGKFADKLTSLASDQIISQLFKGLVGGGGSGGLLASIMGLFGGGGGSAAAAAVEAPFALGGIMTSRGPLPLNRYAGGGIADRPQLAMFGEGRGPEAYVPLPDGRSIPVAMKAPAMAPASGPVQIFHTNNGTPQVVQSANMTTDAHGNRRIDMVTADLVAGTLASGAVKSGMRSVYGARQQVTRR